MKKYLKDYVKAVEAYVEATNRFLDKSTQEEFARKGDARNNATRSVTYAENAKNILNEVG